MFKETTEWATASKEEWNENILKMTPERTVRAVRENSPMDRHIFGRSHKRSPE
jgi:predicted Fe-S protein YdhL (DUF1289 family)